MTPDERELLRALDARSGEVSPEFRSRLSGALQGGRPSNKLLPAIALMTAIVLSLASVGILLMGRNIVRVSQGGPASGSRLALPTDMRFGMPEAVQLSAPSGDVVWANIGGHGLFRSTDGGNNWSQRSLPNELGIFLALSISFVNNREGWVLGVRYLSVPQCAEEAALWHTTDAGATWKQLTTTGLASMQCEEEISFVDSAHGLLIASDPNRGPTIYRTSDGGHRWAPSTLPDPPGFVTQAGFTLRVWSVKAFGHTVLVTAMGPQEFGQQSASIFRSTDDGAGWSYLSPVLGNEVFVTANRWLRISNNQTSDETLDGGRTWHPWTVDYSDAAGVYSIFVFADDKVGYAISPRGPIGRTVDGGAHWMRIMMPGP